MLQCDSEVLSMARGDVPAEIVIKNGQIVDVFNGEIFPGDVAIARGHIIGVGAYAGSREIDAGGAFVAPGFIDAHVHLESSMVSPACFSSLVLPRGTTTVVADPHELANVYGAEAIRYMLAADETMALDLYIMLPSCVPATGLETSGAALTAADLGQFIGQPKVLGLGEMMDYRGVINGETLVWSKLRLFRERGLPVDGHIQGVSEKDLCAYALAGIGSNHECTTAEDGRACLRAGMRLMLREGTAARNLVDLLPAVNERTLPQCMLCTDDRHPTDIVSEGHIDHLVRLCIANGLRPVDAIRMATINPARYFGLQQLGGVAPGFQADLLLIGDLSRMNVRQVFKKGEPVAADGLVVGSHQEGGAGVSMPSSMHVAGFDAGRLQLPLRDEAHVIRIAPGQITTEHLVVPSERYTSGADDIIKLVVVERHRGTGNIGLGLVSGFGIRNGAIGSTVAHDSHNIIVAGDNDRDIMLAIAEIVKLRGGLVVAGSGRVLASLALPLGGLMSDQGSGRVLEGLRQVAGAAHQLGAPAGFDSFMTLSFLSLPVIPKLRLTDRGLVDVEKFAIIPL